jgi:hypothetical protein
MQNAMLLRLRSYTVFSSYIYTTVQYIQSSKLVMLIIVTIFVSLKIFS